MITLTINDIINIAPILQELTKESFASAITFKIARLIRELNKEIDLFEVSRNTIIEKYGERNSNGNIVFTENGNVKVQDDKIKECEDEFRSLLSYQLNINAEKIPASAFDRIEITPAQAMVIEPIIDFE